MNEENNCKYVSSRGILKSCDIFSSTPISDVQSFINYDLSGLKENSIVYVSTSAIPYFFKIVMPSLTQPIILVSGDSDLTCPNNIFSSDKEFLQFIECDKITHWFSQNCILTEHYKITQMPIGLDYHTMSIQDHSWGKKIAPLEQENVLESIKSKSKPFHEREIKAYSNFHFFMTTKFGQDRIDAKNQIPPHLVYYEPNKIERQATWEKQSEYAFVISPHGNGLDCHRTWEALCLGCIPIVKSSPLDLLYEDLPVLIVKEWSDVSQDLLNNTITKFKNRKFNYDKLNLKYWINKIKAYKLSFDIMKTKSVIITGCCRNVEVFINRNLSIMNKIGKKFKEYKIIIYENDSCDSTRKLLIDNKKPEYDYIFEDNVNIENRTMRIAHCRNKIIDHINKKYLNYDYILMLDLDDVLASGRLIETINTCFFYNTTQWDAMFANCSDKYYDIYALRKTGLLTSCCWNNVNVMKRHGIPHHIAYKECIDKYIVNYPIYTKIMPVLSAFGGAGLYKLKSIDKAIYIGREETHVDKQICEHVSFNAYLINKGYKIYINPRMLIR